METRIYSYKDDVMLIKTKVGIRNAKVEVAAFSVVQPDINIENLNTFETDVDHALANMLGLDKNGELKKATKSVSALTQTAFDTTRLLKILIENNFKKEKDELHAHLGYDRFYRDVSKLKQEATISLLSSIARDEANIKQKFESRSLPVVIIDEIVQLSKDLIEAETTQEQLKGSSKPITEEQLKTLNGLYNRIMDICKLGQVLFAKDEIKKEKFIFSKLAGGI